MGELKERCKLSILVNGNGVGDAYQNNTLYFYNKFSESDEEVKSVSPVDIQLGRFYHLHCQDESNWIQYSPIFTVDFKKFSNVIMILGLNLNFLPFEIREAIFDKYMTDKDFEDDRSLKVSFQGVYKELMKWGFEYAIVEYSVHQIVLAHKINMSVVPRFLYSSYPKNKYDPEKLYKIWEAKIGGRVERDAEMNQLLMRDFTKASEEINENFKLLKDHIFRVQKRLRGK
jgi:hypothetical protein